MDNIIASLCNLFVKEQVISLPCVQMNNSTFVKFLPKVGFCEVVVICKTTTFREGQVIVMIRILNKTSSKTVHIDLLENKYKLECIEQNGNSDFLNQ